MSNEHPITPPPELLQQWAVDYWGNPGESIGEGEKHIATQAARWGADAELEACRELLDINGCSSKWIDMLRAARRPKPPSLAEQALAELDLSFEKGYIKEAAGDTIRVALERLQELEKLHDDQG